MKRQPKTIDRARLLAYLIGMDRRVTAKQRRSFSTSIDDPNYRDLVGQRRALHRIEDYVRRMK